MGPQKATIKVVLEEISGLKNLITQNDNKMKNMQETFMTKMNYEFDRILMRDEFMQECKNTLNMIVQQNQTLQIKANEDYLIIISYEKERNDLSYCQNVLSNFRISKNDILGHQVIFSSNDKIVCKEKLANKFKVNSVLKEKSCLRGRRLYIHRPYTDFDKKIHSKQLNCAKKIANTKVFRIFRNKLNVGNVVYDWDSDIEDFILLDENNVTEVITPSVIVPVPVDESITTSHNRNDSHVLVCNLQNLMEEPNSNYCETTNSSIDEVKIKADIMKTLFSMTEKFDKITSSTSKMTENLDEISRKFNEKSKPP